MTTTAVIYTTTAVIYVDIDDSSAIKQWLQWFNVNGAEGLRPTVPARLNQPTASFSTTPSRW